MSASTWLELMADLRARGRAKRESGAFLLGRAVGQVRLVQRWVAYDVLDPDALSYGYVRLNTQAFTKLWALCEELRLEVVADVHTHPGNPRQSSSDRANPMISQPGHVALIVPNFAQGVVLPYSVSVNIYAGNKRWNSFFGRNAEMLIHLK